MKLTKTFFNRFIPAMLLVFIANSTLFSQIIITDPLLPTDDTEITITFNAVGTGLEGYTGDVYAHTGVNIEGVGNWQYVIGDWNNNNNQPQLTRLETDLYELVISPNIREFYNVPDGPVITGLAFVFRSSNSSQQTNPDIFLDVYEASLNVAIINPPKGQPIVEDGDVIEILAAAIESQELKLFINDEEVASTTNSQITYTFDTSEYDFGTWWITATASDGNETIQDESYLFIRPEPPVAALPDDVIPGINYIDDSTVTLVLHDPPALKDYVFLIGDFNDWMITEEYYMNVTPDGTHYWITLSDLIPDTEYGFQYFIDNELRIADPYTHKILDPWNDQWIDNFNYPDLKPYPHDKTNGLVSIMHPGKTPYEWEVTDFTPPAKEDMVVYELHIRDFVETSAIKTVMDSLDYLQRLGVNVIELMPINQFGGNNSWGYNPMTYFATDKTYGTREDYKRFIDAAHSRGMAVVLDIVLNHTDDPSPLVQMYYDHNLNRPSPENPWYLETCPTEPWCWFQTFDQESEYTHEYFKRIVQYWLTEFNIDGYRFDFTKGFTNEQTGGDGWNYDAARIANLKRIADQVWEVNPDAYVILEHFTANNEEKELADYGMMLWGNITHQYQEASMGWLNESNFESISYQQRGWNEPHLVGYMESHDEERIMYKNQVFGNVNNPGHNIRRLGTALRRTQLAATFFFTIPGPKMIWQFGELGYDYSINHCGNDPNVDPIPANIDDDDPGKCRTDPKPVRWDYYDDWQRKRNFDIFAMLINLKTEHDVFRTEDYSLSLSGADKTIHLNHESNNVTVIGNFGIDPIDINPNFQQTGTWYEFFSRDQMEVSDVNAGITLQPGEFRLYSTVEFPDHGVSLSSEQESPLENTQINVYPNPSETGFKFSFNAKEDYHIRIVNVQGQKVFEKTNVFGSGQSAFFWDGTLSNGTKAGSGIYFYSVFSGSQSINGKIMVR
jgi:1,4-alpha-glucan branching enzyme